MDGILSIFCFGIGSRRERRGNNNKVGSDMQTFTVSEERPVPAKHRKARVSLYPQCAGCLNLSGPRCKIFVNRRRIFSRSDKCPARQIDPVVVQSIKQSLVAYRREHMISKEVVSGDIVRPAVVYMDANNNKWFVSKAVAPAYADYRVYRLRGEYKQLRQAEDMGTLNRDLGRAKESVLWKRLHNLAVANGWRRFRVKEKSNVENRKATVPYVR